jgi:hypothetical protein
MMVVMLQTFRTKCMCIDISRQFSAVFFFFTFYMFLIVLPQSFVFKMQRVRPKASPSAQDSIKPFHTMGAITYQLLIELLSGGCHML